MAIDANIAENSKQPIRELSARLYQSRIRVYGLSMLAALLFIASLWVQPWISIAELFQDLVAGTMSWDECCPRYFSSDTIQYSIFVLIGITTFLAVEVIYLSLSHRAAHKRNINKRHKVLEKTGDHHDALLQLRRSRSLTADGHYMLPITWLNQMILQSGSELRLVHLLALDGVFSMIVFFTVFHILESLLLAGGTAICAAVILPLIVLKVLIQRRRKLFESQLPDAVDVLIRSLKVGHPLHVSIAMVSREMSDPIGTEFGLTADELTYGLDLESAMNNMSDRVGQEDLSLLVAAVTIQEKTGGNLIEIMSNLSFIIRARFKMRRKARAFSAEGRFSGLFFSALPIAVFGSLMTVDPNYYGDVWHEPIVKKVLALAVCVMLVGNFILHRMVNFKH